MEVKVPKGVTPDSVRIAQRLQDRVMGEVNYVETFTQVLKEELSKIVGGLESEFTSLGTQIGMLERERDRLWRVVDRLIADRDSGKCCRCECDE